MSRWPAARHSAFLLPYCAGAGQSNDRQGHIAYWSVSVGQTTCLRFMMAKRSARERLADRQTYRANSGRSLSCFGHRPRSRRDGGELELRACSIAVSKLDRLSRDVHFISGLMTHRVPFLVSDLAPMLTPSFSTYSLLWRRKSERWSASAQRKPAAAKAKGVQLGNPRINQARKKAAAEIVERADQRAANLVPVVRQIQGTGATSLRQIADALNARVISARAASMVRHVRSQRTGPRA